MDTALFQPLTLKGVTLPNRIAISPMQQYMAGRDGFVRDWHFVHLAKMAVGGAGTVFTEALAVVPEGRVTYHDLGIWSDDHIEGLKRLAGGIADNGAIPATQLIHAGRKASVAPPYHGFEPLSQKDADERGEEPWPVVSASALEANPGWPTPSAMSKDDIKKLLDQFAASTRRARKAGFQVLDMHGAHGYLIHCFLSPLSNTREDEYGGDMQGRMRLALEVADAVRSEWPSDLPFFYRLSCIDDAEGGWTLDDSVELSLAFKNRGVDVIDCSSGGLGRRTTPLIIPRNPGYQVPFSDRIRTDSGMPTMAVGLIMDPVHANSIIENEEADIIAIGREALNNPNWGLHARIALDGLDAYEPEWPKPYGWWLVRRAKALEASKQAEGQ